MNAPAYTSEPTRVPLLEQGSEAWHAHRALYANASEAGAVLGVSPFNPSTRRQLALVKSGAYVIEVNPAMRRGNQFEGAARRAAEDAIGIDFVPAVFVRDRFSASLDGLSECSKILLEIKIPAKGEQSDLWRSVMAGDGPPLHYLAQIAQQVFCSGAEVAIFWVYDPEQDIGIPYRLTAEELAPTWAAVRTAWAEYFAEVDAGRLPAPVAGDEVALDNATAAEAAGLLLSTRAEIKKLEAQAEACESIIRELAPREWTSIITTPAGVLRAQWITRAGAVDYSKVPALAGVDLDSYRKKGTTYFQLKEGKS